MELKAPQAHRESREFRARRGLWERLGLKGHRAKLAKSVRKANKALRVMQAKLGRRATQGLKGQRGMQARRGQQAKPVLKASKDFKASRALPARQVHRENEAR